MMDRPNGLDVAMSVTARLNAAELELANLRAHLTAVALDDAPAFNAARSARVVAAMVDDVASDLRSLGARQASVIS
jgi:hypothetical protein